MFGHIIVVHHRFNSPIFAAFILQFGSESFLLPLLQVQETGGKELDGGAGLRILLQQAT